MKRVCPSTSLTAPFTPERRNKQNRARKAAGARTGRNPEGRKAERGGSLAQLPHQAVSLPPEMRLSKAACLEHQQTALLASCIHRHDTGGGVANLPAHQNQDQLSRFNRPGSRKAIPRHSRICRASPPPAAWTGARCRMPSVTSPSHLGAIEKRLYSQGPRREIAAQACDPPRRTICDLRKSPSLTAAPWLATQDGTDFPVSRMPHEAGKGSRDIGLSFCQSGSDAGEPRQIRVQP